MRTMKNKIFFNQDVIYQDVCFFNIFIDYIFISPSTSHFYVMFQCQIYYRIFYYSRFIHTYRHFRPFLLVFKKDC